MGCRDSYGLTNSPDYVPEQTECLEVSSIWSDLCPSTEGLISLGLDLTPGIGSLKSLEEFAVGTNALTGEKVGKLGAGIGCVPCVKGLAKVGKEVFNVSKRVGRAASSFFRSSSTLDTLSKAGQVLDRGGLTKAGRAIDKHGNRPNSVFPKATGNPLNKNIQGQYQLDDILTHPKSVIIDRSLPKYGNVIEVKIPGCRGVRFSPTGDFIMFLEP
jgi:hypothetical protein